MALGSRGLRLLSLYSLAGMGSQGCSWGEQHSLVRASASVHHGHCLGDKGTSPASLLTCPICLPSTLRGALEGRGKGRPVGTVGSPPFCLQAPTPRSHNSSSRFRLLQENVDTCAQMAHCGAILKRKRGDRNIHRKETGSWTCHTYTRTPRETLRRQDSSTS